MNNVPDIILVMCEGKTEVLYFRILKKNFRLPSLVKILPNLDNGEYRTPGQHEKLIEETVKKREELLVELGEGSVVEAWSVCDRDEYKDSFTKLKKYADERDVHLAFSDPQFESFLLQHFSLNKSKSSGAELEKELSNKMLDIKFQFGLYNKSDLGWLEEMIDKKHSVVNVAVKNAAIFDNHTKQPFFTVHELVDRLLGLIEEG